MSGSSPRLRGTRSASDAAAAPRRFIPASAGNTKAPRREPSKRSVHPRVCGEHQHMASGKVADPGSSPRLRGTH